MQTTFDVRVIAVAITLLAACSFDRPEDVSEVDPSLQIEVTSGDGQSGTAGTELEEPFIVTVRDADRQPVENLTVEFTVESGGGRLAEDAVQTDALGQARSTLTLGGPVGENQVRAGSPVLVDSVVFTATGTVGAPARLVRASAATQTATVATAVDPHVVRVEDAHGNPVPGQPVAFAVTAGGGTLSQSAATTEEDGAADTIHTLGTVAGTHTVEASAGDLEPVHFDVTAVAAAAAAISRTSGDQQVGTALAPLAAPFVVTVRDAHGNAVEGTPVMFAVTAGDGALSNTEVTTDAQGHAATTLTPGSFGDVTVSASADGLAGSPVVFRETTRRFASRIDAPVGGSHAVAVGDVTGDQKPDFVVASGTGGILVVPNTTPVNATIATFGTPVGFATLMDARFVALADIDGDGKQDVLASGPDGGGFNGPVVLVNQTSSPGATPSFASVRFAGSVGGPIAIVDVNADGKPDVVTACCPNGDDRVSVLINRTTGATTSFTETFIGLSQFGLLNPSAIAVGDVDGDNEPELVVLAVNFQGSPRAVIFRNATATGASFPTLSLATTTSAQPDCLAVGDIDGDGRADLATAGFSGNQAVLSIRLSTSDPGSASFAGAVDFPTGPLPQSIAILDVNADGRPEIAVGDVGDATVSVFLNRSIQTGQVALAPRIDLSTRPSPFVASADVNRDGKPDLVTQGVSVFLAQ